MRGSAEYKRHLADELTRRALRRAVRRARPGEPRNGGLTVQVSMTVNGNEVTEEIEGRLLLVHFLRDHLGLTGTHWGCDTSNCGTCVVWLDGEPVKSCTVLAAMAGGHEVRTVEGLERRRPARPRPAGLHGLPRASVRVLHAGDDDDGPGAARPQPGPVRSGDPGGDLRPDLPLHRLCHHRPLRPVGRLLTRPAKSTPVKAMWPRWWGARHDHRGAPAARQFRRQRPKTGRLRAHAAQGRPPLHPGPGPLLRRRATARHAPPGHPALARGPRPGRAHRHQRGRWPTPR